MSLSSLLIFASLYIISDIYSFFWENKQYFVQHMLLGRYLYPFLLNDQKKREREQQSLKPFFPWCLDNVYPPRSSSLLVFPTYQGKSSKTVSVPFSLHNYDGTQLHSTTERCSALEKKVEDIKLENGSSRD